MCSALCSGLRPLIAPTRPAATARCGRGPRSSQPPSGQTSRANRASPRPWLREARRAAGDGVRASVSASASSRARSPRWTAAATDAVIRPCVRILRFRNASRVARSLTMPQVTASSRPPECTCAPVGSRESDSVRSTARVCHQNHQNRKYRCAIGSSAAGSCCHTRPSMRTVKVSGSTSMWGKASSR